MSERANNDGEANLIGANLSKVNLRSANLMEKVQMNGLSLLLRR